jgi:hypothetical protein
MDRSRWPRAGAAGGVQLCRLGRGRLCMASHAPIGPERRLPIVQEVRTIPQDRLKQLIAEEQIRRAALLEHRQGIFIVKSWIVMHQPTHPIQRSFPTVSPIYPS